MGKYLTKFANHAAYEAAESGLILPNVSLCVQQNEVHYKSAPDYDSWTGYKPNLSTEFDIVEYIKTYIHRPYEDIVADATARNDSYTLEYIGAVPENNFWKEQYEECVSLFPNDYQGNPYYSYYPYDGKYAEVDWDGVNRQFLYDPTDGYVIIQAYDA